MKSKSTVFIDTDNNQNKISTSRTIFAAISVSLRREEESIYERKKE